MYTYKSYTRVNLPISMIGTRMLFEIYLQKENIILNPTIDL